ncbi:sigma-70 family RNA polymerase sigma factor [Bordetella petrii]|uniref:Sigma-70 family RNA polymerase sigma factor n=1 Tax=Bordetella petrii TaxID=94624 RepID=A0ABT7W1F1_9BORD|nr:sigma-70 family RNA polymerase sigma factor [Bordetella petrii]MDM9559010.1 sigma-70 family RNA polymerase sigma factor [Bordetella petrii]
MIRPVPLPVSAPAPTDDDAPPADELSDAVLRQLLPRLRRFALRLTREPAAADDLVQATLERALTRWGSRRPQGDIRAWLFTILYRQFLDSQRRMRRHSRLLEWFAGADAAAPSSERQALARASLATFELLPEAQRTLLWLVCVEGLSYKAVADLFEVPLGTVMSRLSRARSALRDLNEGQTGAAHLRIMK